MAIPGAIPAPGDSLARVTDAVRQLFQNGAAAGASGGSGQYNLSNGKITESHTGNAVTFALKDLDGNDPSSGSRVSVQFGDGTQYDITSALSVTVSSGSTLGATSAAPFRVWVALIDDGGTMRLGVRNCRTTAGTTGGVSGFPASGALSSTAEGGAGAADSAGVTYTGTAVSAKQFLIVARAEYDSGLTTAGTWDASPTRIVLHGPGSKAPGDMVQAQTTQIINSGPTKTDTSIVATNLTVSITPTSACNPIALFACGTLVTLTAGRTIYMRFMRAGAAIGQASGLYFDTVPLASTSAASIGTLDSPATTAATTYAVGGYIGGGAGSWQFPGGLTDSIGGGFISATEIMA